MAQEDYWSEDFDQEQNCAQKERIAELQDKVIKSNIHMVDIVQDGYFLQKLSLFCQLHRLFLSTFGIEPPPSIDFSGQ